MICMVYTCYNMNAYNLHVIKTDKFKTITIDVVLEEKLKKRKLRLEIYLRN